MSKEKTTQKERAEIVAFRIGDSNNNKRYQLKLRCMTPIEYYLAAA
ncbi:MAG: hypothetical protein IJZ51_08205 [Ruminiclostridium sp.]|nr:hypothetical protein [Ruminiclostridium sp.]